MKKNLDTRRVLYYGEEFKVVFGPPIHVEQRNGALIGSGMPSINLVDPITGKVSIGLTVEIPIAPLKTGQVLDCGKSEGLRVLTEAGVVRYTGEFYRSREYDATLAVCDLVNDEPEQQKTTLEQVHEAARCKQGGGSL